jgi:DNA repair photolyase
MRDLDVSGFLRYIQIPQLDPWRLFGEASMQQAGLFLDIAARSTRTLPVVGEQKDIRYYGTTARSVLNGPESTGMDFWSINPYIGCAFGCTYCYARYAHRYVVERSIASEVVDDTLRGDVEELEPWLAFERRIFVKRNAPEVLRRTLMHGGERVRAVLSGAETVVIGTATDPFQPAERVFRVTRGLLEVLAEHSGLRVVVITKSPLITRDVDLLARIAARSSFTVHLSLITLDRELARRLEPRAPTPESRLRALARLSAAGIDVGINVMPVLPGITDQPADLVALVRRVRDAGASHVHAGSLRLQSSARLRYLPFVKAEFPHLAKRYQATYAEADHVGDRYQDGLQRFFEKTCREEGITYGTPERSVDRHADPWRQADDGIARAAAGQLELGV